MRDDGLLNANQNRQLFNFVRSFAVTIPATYKYTKLIRESLEEINYFNMFKRTNNIELTILCDASSWKNPENVYVKFDFLQNTIKMKKINKQSNIWQVVVELPKEAQNISFNFYKTEDISNSKVDWKYKVFARDEGDGKMRVEATVPRDYTQELIIECDLNNSDIYSVPYLIYASIGYSNTQKDKIKMRDDGKEGDRQANDNIYTCRISIPPEILLTTYAFVYSDQSGQHKSVHNNYKITSNKRLSTNTVYKVLNNLKQ